MDESVRRISSTSAHSSATFLMEHDMKKIIKCQVLFIYLIALKHLHVNFAHHLEMGTKGKIQKKIYLQLLYYTNIKECCHHIPSSTQYLLFLEHLTAVFQVFNQEVGNTSERLNGCFV